MLPCKRYSVVVEMENAKTIHFGKVGQMLRVLAAQIADSSIATYSHDPQVICVHPGPERESKAVRDQIVAYAPTLDAVADLSCLGVPNGRYYELKNAGIAQATGDVVVLVDSDMLPEDGWLAALLSPFGDADTVAVGGHTYLGHDCLVSRTLAMVWVFPLRDHDNRQANRRPLYSNNCAFQANWIRANPYPDDDGFKVACTRHAHQLRQHGHEPVRVPAYARHASLSGFRFLAWRGWVTGRDADRKVVALRSSSRLRRFTRALKVVVKMESRTIRRVLVHHRHVALPGWQIPAAVALGSLFYGLAFCGQLAQLSGLATSCPERIPEFAEAH